MLALVASLTHAKALPDGRSRQAAPIGREQFSVDVYRPSACQLHAILIVLSGKYRNSATYRDDTIPLARATCSLVFAPDFPLARFPVQQYQRGGYPAAPKTLPAANYMKPIENWARSVSGTPHLPVILIGHSAGAQFLERVVAYAPGDEILTVIMNPSTYVEADMGMTVPYGFHDWPQNSTLPDLRRYLSKKIAIILGAEDTASPLLTDRIPAAVEQGNGRLERGQWAYVQAQSESEKLHTSFGWTITLVPGTGHNASEMLASTEVADAVEAAIRSASSQ